MTAWVITDGNAGNENQAVALAEWLGTSPRIIRAKRYALLDWLPGNITLGALAALGKQEAWPDLLITCGRRSAAFSIAVKRASRGKTKTIHLLDPRIAPKHFDLVVAPSHDALMAENVIRTEFALHRITPAFLLGAQTHWAAHFLSVPRPIIGVLLGGSTNKYTLDEERFSALILQLEILVKSHAGSVCIVPSRRTGEVNINALKVYFAGYKNVFITSLAGAGEANPYHGVLALSEQLVVTNDSVNMISEALATGKPVHILALPEHSNTKPALFAQAMLARGYAQRFALPLTAFTAQVPEEREKIKQEIIKRLK